MNATEDLILSTPHKAPPTPANPGKRPSYRDVMIDKLAESLATAAYGQQTCIDGMRCDLRQSWLAVAEAAVDELIDRPEREFQQQLAAVVASNQDADAMAAWVPATAGAWL